MCTPTSTGLATPYNLLRSLIFHKKSRVPPDSSFRQINSPINLDSGGPQFKQRFEIVELFVKQHGGEEFLWDKSGDISV